MRRPCCLLLLKQSEWSISVIFGGGSWGNWGTADTAGAASLGFKLESKIEKHTFNMTCGPVDQKNTTKKCISQLEVKWGDAHEWSNWPRRSCKPEPQKCGFTTSGRGPDELKLMLSHARSRFVLPLDPQEYKQRLQDFWAVVDLGFFFLTGQAFLAAFCLALQRSMSRQLHSSANSSAASNHLPEEHEQTIAQLRKQLRRFESPLQAGKCM